MFHVSCQCGSRLRLPETHVGKRAACPSCKKVVRIVAPARVAKAGEVRGAPTLHCSQSSGTPVAKAGELRGALTVQEGPCQVGEQIFLGGDGAIELGKLPGKHIALAGELVSRNHARLIPTSGGWRIEDCGSKNGVLVQGQKIAAHDLSDGDVIQIGEFKLSYRFHDDAPPEPAPPQSDDGERVEDDFLYDLREEEFAPQTAAPAAARPQGVLRPPGMKRPVCPCCEKALEPLSKICVDCGIDIKTGRAILTAHDSNLDYLYASAERYIRGLSWIFWSGLYPIASEAFGTRKPHVIRGIAIVTIVVSMWFLIFEWSGSPEMRTLKNFMLWAGDADPPEDEIEYFYDMTEYGDREAYLRQRARLEDSVREDSVPEDEVYLTAYKSLTPQEKCLGEFRWWQLLTHILLHGGPVHLIGNLIFLMVFGSRVNALIGNAATLILYPVLGVIAALSFMATLGDHPPLPMLGASGAIMGLAGMYLVLFPVHNVHMAFWYRWGLFVGFHLSLRLFAVRGFWVVLAYILVDALMIALEIEDQVAHWAHLGGFLGGAGLALILLLTRVVHGRGGDLVSVILGKRAWSILGKPNARKQSESPAAGAGQPS